MWDSFVSSIEMIEELAKHNIPTIRIKEERGVADGTHCSIDANGNPVLHWDSLMYEFFEKELTLLDTFSYVEGADDKIITEMGYNYLGVLFDHLSEKNKREPYISDALRKKANSFNFPFFNYMHKKVPEVSEWKAQLFIQTGVFKLLIMYHEIAHLLFSLNHAEREKWENLVISNIQALHHNNYEKYLFTAKDKTSKKRTLKLLSKLRKKDKSCQTVLSELAADAFAVSKAYATTHLNINAVDDESISDNIMVAYLRYIDISSQYAYIVDFWGELYGMCISQKKMSVSIEDSLSENTAMHSVRCELCGVVSLINILQMDICTWNYNPPNGVSLADPRIINAIRIFTINASHLSKITTAAISPQLFNEIVEESNLLKKQAAHHFEYPVIPEGAVIASWLSIQYYNSCGMEKRQANKFREALNDFRLACSITEQYLGHNHRLTARIFNNICSCYLDIATNSLKETNKDAVLNSIEILELACYHSSIALSILHETSAIEDIQAGAIYQNAGETHALIGRYEDAISYYLHAKSVKHNVYPRYAETHAITDYSLACAYYKLNRFLDAKRSCEDALSFYMCNAEEEDQMRKKIEALYEHIKYMMVPSGESIFNIFGLMINGKTVDLTQYTDWDELLNKKE